MSSVITSIGETAYLHYQMKKNGGFGVDRYYNLRGNIAERGSQRVLTIPDISQMDEGILTNNRLIVRGKLVACPENISNVIAKC